MPRNPAILVADIGVPMIFVTLPLMAAALVPVILVEVWVGKPVLQTSYGRSAWAFTVANVASTIIGIPVAWGFTFGLEFLVGTTLGDLFSSNLSPGPVLKIVEVILMPAWLGPTDSDLYWAVPLAAMVMLIPSFFASWSIEAFIIDKMVEPGWPIVHSATLKANLASYGLLLVGGCGWLIYSLIRHGAR
jgi:hypothetical protein